MCTVWLMTCVPFGSQVMNAERGIVKKTREGAEYEMANAVKKVIWRSRV